MARTVAEWQKYITDAMAAKGFHDDIRPFPARLTTGWRFTLIHSEVTEAAQEVKRHVPMNQGPTLTEQQKAKIGPELADVFVRLADFCGVYGIDLEMYVEQVMQKNLARPYKYGTPDAGRHPDAPVHSDPDAPHAPGT